MQSLIDLGERQILDTIIPRFVAGAGDDCATIDLPGAVLVATTDPVPPPAAASIGKDEDPFWLGWLLVTINVSDLAAAGARPLAFLAALECEATRSVSEFERIFEGIKAGCEDAKISYVGGNIREATRLTAVGVALGICRQYAPLRRTGASDGDIILSVGQGGVFWRDALRMLDGAGEVHKETSPLYKPRSQIGVMHQLAAKGLLTAAMDNSDGLLPTLSELAKKNKLGVEIDVQYLLVPGVAEGERVDQARMWLGWGDWNVIASVREANLAQVLQLGREVGVALVPIGRFSNHFHGVVLCNGEHSIAAPRLESERFARDSWMLKGIDEYVRMLRAVELP